MSIDHQNLIYLSVVIPAYNEGKKIERDVFVLCEFLRGQEYRSEIIIVNDGSQDATSSVLNRLQEKFPELKVISYERNQGKGYALKRGILSARGKVVLFADTGSCVPYSYVSEGLKLLSQNFSIAIGSRRHFESAIIARQPYYRRAGAKFFSWIVHHIIGIKNISDTQCGFKLFTHEAAKRIFEENRIKGFMFDVETILRAQRWGYRIAEFPVSWSNDPDSRFHPFWGSFRNIYELAQIKMLLKGRRLQ